MRQALHTGDDRDLNWYMIDQLKGDYWPVKWQTKVYCMPPPASPGWLAEDLGDSFRDGCVMATGAESFHSLLAMQRWVGLCDYHTQ